MSKYYSIAEARADAVDNGWGDEALQKTINEAEAMFESLTTRQFDTRTLTLTFDGDGSTVIYIREYPIISINSLVIDGETIPSEYYAVTNDSVKIIEEFRFNVYRGSTHYAFTRGTQNVVITGSFGYAVDSAALILVKKAIRSMTEVHTTGTAVIETYESEKIGDYSYKSGTLTGKKMTSVYGEEVNGIISQLRRRIGVDVI